LAFQLGQPVPDGLVECGEHRQLSGLGGQGGEHRRLKVGGQDDALLGGEVAEEGGRRYLGCGGDLLGGGLVIALFPEQAQALGADLGAGAGLFPLPQSGLRRTGRRGVSGH